MVSRADALFSLGIEWMPLNTVHPHGCGEQRVDMWYLYSPNGSSPRVWGTEKVAGFKTIFLRFIPTGVGNSMRNIPTEPSIPVHPHGCGEQFFIGFLKFFSHGSSPRVWGTDGNPTVWGDVQRFIPTGVGNRRILI